MRERARRTDEKEERDREQWKLKVTEIDRKRYVLRERWREKSKIREGESDSNKHKERWREANREKWG